MHAVVLPADLLIYAAAIALPVLVVVLAISARNARREEEKRRGPDEDR